MLSNSSKDLKWTETAVTVIKFCFANKSKEETLNIVGSEVIKLYSGNNYPSVLFSTADLTS